MKEKISRTSLVVYAVLLVLSWFFPSAAGDAVVWYCIIGLFAIPPIVAGPLKYKIPGLIALLIAIALAGADYHIGKRIHDRWEENARRREGLANPVDEIVSMEAHERLLERINRNGDINYDIIPRPLVTLEEFFEGNKDYGSIGYNFYPDQPSPSEFYHLFKTIRDKADVADVRVEIKDLEDPEGWPSTDTVWIVTKASVSDIKKWLGKRFEPDDIIVGFTKGYYTREHYEIPEGMQAIGVWWD